MLDNSNNNSSWGFSLLSWKGSPLWLSCFCQLTFAFLTFLLCMLKYFIIELSRTVFSTYLMNQFNCFSLTSSLIVSGDLLDFTWFLTIRQICRNYNCEKFLISSLSLTSTETRWLDPKFKHILIEMSFTYSNCPVGY